LCTVFASLPAEASSSLSEVNRLRYRKPGTFSSSQNT
jgi:hypothetical protein